MRELGRVAGRRDQAGTRQRQRSIHQPEEGDPGERYDSEGRRRGTGREMNRQNHPTDCRHIIHGGRKVRGSSPSLRVEGRNIIDQH